MSETSDLERAAATSSHLLQTVLIDYASILFFALFTLGIFMAPTYHLEHRVVPLCSVGSGGTGGSPHASILQPPIYLEYPWKEEPLPSRSCGVVVVVLPLLIVVAFQFRTRNLWDLHSGVVGVLKAVVSTAFVVTILKQFIGGFRPYFIEACRPDMSLAFKEFGSDLYWLNATACTGAPYDIKKALQSFPSGHTANAFAAAIFTSLYLNAKIKPFGDHASNMWSTMITIAPLIGASLISGSMYLSHQHHAEDIVFGIIIGLVLGLMSFRSRYTAVLDFRYNHISLPSCTSNALFYSQDLFRKLSRNLSKSPPCKKVNAGVWDRRKELQQRTSSLQNCNPITLKQ